MVAFWGELFARDERRIRQTWPTIKVCMSYARRLSVTQTTESTRIIRNITYTTSLCLEPCRSRSRVGLALHERPAPSKVGSACGERAVLFGIDCPAAARGHPGKPWKLHCSSLLKGTCISCLFHFSIQSSASFFHPPKASSVTALTASSQQHLLQFCMFRHHPVACESCDVPIFPARNLHVHVFALPIHPTDRR